MDQQQQQAFAAMAGMMGFIAIFGLAFTIFGVFCLWRIFTKAGMSGALSLLVLIPGVGAIIALCILAFGEWRVVPRPTAGYPPPYPPPGGYPPGNYPPAV